MSTPEDVSLGKTALADGVIRPEQLAECFRLQKKYEASGRKLSLAQVLLEKRYVDPAYIESRTGISTETAGALSPTFDTTVVLTPAADANLHFGRYQVIKELGRGGMGCVYQVFDPELKRMLALKVLLSEESENQVARFLLEAKATAELHHPNIVGVYDTGRESGQNFFTMEFVDGASLEALSKRSAMSARRIAEIMAKVASAIHYAHGKGIIHRDIKPANIMVDGEGEVKVMDFGLAKVTKADQKLSMSGVVIGTMYYMPPEQALGKRSQIDARSDVYAMGAVLYELLIGRPPFTGNTMAKMIEQITSAGPVPPREIKRNIPKELERICLRALAKKKEQRHSSAEEFARELTRFLQKKVRADSPRTPSRFAGMLRKRWPLVATTALGLAVLFIIGLIFFTGSGQVVMRSRQLPPFPDPDLAKKLDLMRAKDAYSLLGELSGKDETAKKAAAIALEERLNDARLIPALVRRMKESDDLSRHAAAVLLGKIGPGAKSAVPDLIQALPGRDKTLGKYAAKALGDIGAAEAVPELITALQDDEIAGVAAASLEKLGAEAMHQTGECYRHGRGLKKSPREALKWYLKGAAAGHAPSMYLAGYLYKHGDGEVKIDYALALQWLSRAAEAGHEEACYHAGDIYQKGLGVPENPGESCRWFLLGAEAGHSGCLRAINQYVWHTYKDEKDREVTAGQLEILSKASNLTYVDTAAAYYAWKGDVDRAVYCAARAEELTPKRVQMILTGLNPKKVEAIMALEKLAMLLGKARRNDAVAMCDLGEMYVDGDEIPGDCLRAGEWYQRAAELGHPGARDGLTKVEHELRKLPQVPAACNPTSGLLAYYPLNGDGRDHSGNHNHAVVIGAHPIDVGRQGPAYHFDGEDDYIATPLDINHSRYPQVTMGAWVRLSGPSSGRRQVLCHDDRGLDRAVGMDFVDGKGHWIVFCGTSILQSDTVEVGRWTFVAVVFDQDRKSATFYLDDKSLSGPVLHGPSDYALWIGANPGFGEYFPGDIDEVFVYGRALSADEIKRIRKSRE